MNSFLDNRPTVGPQTSARSASEAETSFQPLFAPGAIARPRPVASPVSNGQAEPAPQIELIQNGGRVERIIVTCSCCNRIELQCQY